MYNQPAFSKSQHTSNNYQKIQPIFFKKPERLGGNKQINQENKMFKTKDDIRKHIKAAKQCAYICFRYDLNIAKTLHYLKKFFQLKITLFLFKVLSYE